MLLNEEVMWELAPHSQRPLLSQSLALSSLPHSRLRRSLRMRVRSCIVSSPSPSSQICVPMHRASVKSILVGLIHCSTYHRWKFRSIHTHLCLLDSIDMRHNNRLRPRVKTAGYPIGRTCRHNDHWSYSEAKSGQHVLLLLGYSFANTPRSNTRLQYPSCSPCSSPYAPGSSTRLSIRLAWLPVAFRLRTLRVCRMSVRVCFRA